MRHYDLCFETQIILMNDSVMLHKCDVANSSREFATQDRSTCTQIRNADLAFGRPIRVQACEEEKHLNSSYAKGQGWKLLPRPREPTEAQKPIDVPEAQIYRRVPSHDPQ